jgi:hypothetical protein
VQVLSTARPAGVNRGHKQEGAIPPVILDPAARWQCPRDRDDQFLAATFVQQQSDSTDHGEHEHGSA